MTSLTNEVATLKNKVATLEAEKNNYATKNELASAINELRRLIENLVDGLRRSFEATLRGINDILATLLGRNSAELEQRVRNLEIRTGIVEGITDALRRVIARVEAALQKDIADLQGFKAEVAARFAKIEARLSSLEGFMGQVLMDIKNIYAQLTKNKREHDDIWGQIRLIWGALALIQGQIAAAIAAALVGIKAAIKAIQAQIAALWAAIRALRFLPVPRGRDGRDGKTGKDGRNGRDGKDGKTGKDGRNGRDGKDGKIGKDGRNGKDGKDGKTGEKGKDAKVEYSTVSIRIFTGCNGETPQFTSKSIRVIRGTESQEVEKFEQIALTRANSCKTTDAIAILPEHHQIKTGANIPQLAILWREVKPDGTFTNEFRASTIPHYAGGRKPVFSNYKKGSHYARIILKDNSRIIVYAASQDIAERIAREHLNYVEEKLKPNPVKVSLGQRKGEELAGITVKAVRISYFSAGLKNKQPDWVSEL